MSLKIAIQMDSIQNINIDKDSTFVLALEAQKRGYTLYHYFVSALRLEDGQVTAKANKLEVRREQGNHFTLGDSEIINLKTDVDIVLMRQDPPFDMSYITATHILDHITDDTLVMNNPAHVRNAPEKLLVTHFTDLAPPTLITADQGALRDFYKKHGNVILKPLYGNGGEQVYHIDENSFNLNTLLEMFEAFYKEPIIIQKYLPEARKGDKRIILIEGEAVGAVLRVPAADDARANFHAGGSAQKTTLTEREKQICRTIAPELKKRGLVFVGIDIIGDYLTEINVTSPTGLQEINTLDGVCLEAQLWDAFEARLKKS
ncbi:MAG: glutathione synthase [Zetaproteobacteria bacterium]|nr:MAG: glutathione synthase [Zetaproteobacteria bacterium]